MPRLQPKYEVSTPEQVARSLAETERDCTSIRDLCRKLELPATAFESVASIFLANINGVMASDAEAKMRAQTTKIREIERLRQPVIEKNAHGQIVGVRRLQPLATDYPGVNLAHSVHDDLFDMSEAELDAEIKRLREQGVIP